jgi:hypothetical protein
LTRTGTATGNMKMEGQTGRRSIEAAVHAAWRTRVANSELASLQTGELEEILEMVRLQSLHERNEKLASKSVQADRVVEVADKKLVQTTIEHVARDLLKRSRIWTRRTTEVILLEIVHEVTDYVVAGAEPGVSLRDLAEAGARRLFSLLDAHVKLASGPAGPILTGLSANERQLLRALGVSVVRDPTLAGRWLGWNSTKTNNIWEELRHDLGNLA